MRLIFTIIIVMILGGCTTLLTAADQICSRQDELRLAAIVGLSSDKPKVRDSATYMLRALDACPQLET